MAAKWILVVNRVEARVFNMRDMRLLHRLSNSLGRDKDREFLTGNHDDAAIAFARRLSRFLDKKMNDHGFDQALITAEPRMKGWLKRQMDPKLKGRCQWLSKDLGKLSVHELKGVVRSLDSDLMTDYRLKSR